MAVMTSPAAMPAFAAGPPLVTAATPVPAGVPSAPTTVLTSTPSAPRPELVTLPLLASWAAMSLAVSEEMANPIPGAAPPSCWSVAARVGMPTTCPARSTRAPPLLPGLIDAEVWIVSGRVAPGEPCPDGSDTVRPTADTMPSVTLLAGAVGIAFALTWLLPAASQVLTAAVLSRTSPDLRDLAVALAAGAAGAYATAREDVSAALPGVAVAVALVPPLSATGFTLAIGREDLASGALLLFAANLVAIVLVGSVVPVACGFVPSGRLRAAAGRIRAGFVAVVAAAVVVTAQLTATTLASASHAQTTQAVNQAAVSWLGADPALTLTGTSVSGTLVTVDVTGSTAPPPTTSLAKSLTTVLGPRAAVEVRWYQSTSAASGHGTGSAPLTLAQIRSLVQSWLAGGGASALRIAELTRSANAVSVTLDGSSSPPPALQLAQAVSKRAGQPVTVSVSWRTTPVPGAQTAAPAGSPAVSQARTVIATWLTAHPGPEVLGVSQAGGTVTVDLAGTSPAQVTPACGPPCRISSAQTSRS